MRNGEIDVKRVLEEAVSAALGPAGALESQPWPAPELVADGEGPQAAAREAGTVESALGWPGTSWSSLAPLAPAGTGGSGAADVVSWLNPLVGGLLGLFGGGDEAGQTALPKAVRPARIKYEAGFAGENSELVEIDRDERGQARPAAQAAQVVVNIEAMDSRSFLDRTPEIAEAVKRALLETESLGRLMGGE
jgi:hypothetical protein